MLNYIVLQFIAEKLKREDLHIVYGGSLSGVYNENYAITGDMQCV